MFNMYDNAWFTEKDLIREVRKPTSVSQGDNHYTTWLVESASLTSMQEISQIQYVKDGKTVGGKVVDKSQKSESELGHWYGEITDEYDPYFSGDKYNSKGSRITGSYSWKNGNCGDVDAQKFRGRGFKMLTGRDKYAAYWVYRGWLSNREFDDSWWSDPEYKKRELNKMKKRPALIDEPQRITIIPYNCIDSGGFFITCFRPATLSKIDLDTPEKNNDDIVKLVTEAISGGDIGLPKRIKMTQFAKKVMLDEI